MGKVKYSYIVAFIAIVIFVSGYFLAINKKKAEYIKLKGEYQKINEEVNKAKAVAERKEKALLEYNIIKARWRKANDMLPKDVNLAKILDEITRYSGITRIKILLFRPSQSIIQQAGYGEITMNLEVSGGFHDFGRFLATINNMSRIVNVTSLAIKSEQTNIKATMNLSTYIGQGGEKHEETKTKRKPSGKK